MSAAAEGPASALCPCLFSPPPPIPKPIVILSEGTHSFTVSAAVEGPASAPALAVAPSICTCTCFTTPSGNNIVILSEGTHSPTVSAAAEGPASALCPCLFSSAHPQCRCSSRRHPERSEGPPRVAVAVLRCPALALATCTCTCTCRCKFYAVILSEAKDPRSCSCRCSCSCSCSCSCRCPCPSHAVILSKAKDPRSCPCPCPRPCPCTCPCRCKFYAAILSEAKDPRVHPCFKHPSSKRTQTPVNLPATKFTPQLLRRQPLPQPKNLAYLPRSLPYTGSRRSRNRKHFTRTSNPFVCTILAQALSNQDFAHTTSCNEHIPNHLTFNPPGGAPRRRNLPT